MKTFTVDNFEHGTPEVINEEQRGSREVGLSLQLEEVKSQIKELNSSIETIHTMFKSVEHSKDLGSSKSGLMDILVSILVSKENERKTLYQKSSKLNDALSQLHNCRFF